MLEPAFISSQADCPIFRNFCELVIKLSVDRYLPGDISSRKLAQTLQISDFPNSAHSYWLSSGGCTTVGEVICDQAPSLSPGSATVTSCFSHPRDARGLTTPASWLSANAVPLPLNVLHFSRFSSRVTSWGKAPLQGCCVSPQGKSVLTLWGLPSHPIPSSSKPLRWACVFARHF